MTEASNGKPLRVLIVAETYPPEINGAAIAAERLAHGLLERGHAVRVIAPRSSAGPSHTLTDSAGMTVHQVRSHSVPTHDSFRICYSWEIRGTIREVLDEFRPDVVHSQSHFAICATAMKEARRRGIRVVSTNHFLPANMMPFLPFPSGVKRVVAAGLWRDMNRKLSKADALTTPTPRSVDEMVRNGISNHVRAVSNGIDMRKYALREGEQIPQPERPVALFVGRLAQEKHVDELIRAAAFASDVEFDVEIVGGGEQRPKLEALAESLGVADRVRFLGAVTDEELREAYLRCTFFCLPSTADLQSLATLEALASSKPVVLANALALPHLVHEGVNGYLFEPGDVPQLSEKIRALLSLSPEQLEQMGRESHAMAEKHSFERSLDIFEECYRG
ncbi:MAG: glycosyltransferase [Leucobacter sp.]